MQSHHTRKCENLGLTRGCFRSVFGTHISVWSLCLCAIIKLIRINPPDSFVLLNLLQLTPRAFLKQTRARKMYFKDRVWKQHVKLSFHYFIIFLQHIIFHGIIVKGITEWGLTFEAMDLSFPNSEGLLEYTTSSSFSSPSMMAQLSAAGSSHSLLADITNREYLYSNLPMHKREHDWVINQRMALSRLFTFTEIQQMITFSTTITNVSSYVSKEPKPIPECLQFLELISIC